MILGPVSLLDCAAFCWYLAPQLFIQAGVCLTVTTVLQCLPFLLFHLPYDFFHNRYFVERGEQPPFFRDASPFEDIVIRCVRFSFANISPQVGKAFFSREVSLPFLKFRMWRHGMSQFGVHLHEHSEIEEDGTKVRGIWIRHDPANEPDVCVYYIHGGGFAMGSPWFYLEFLIAWLHLLKEAGYGNPAIFALEYTLVPVDCYPTQMKEAQAGYRHVVSTMGHRACKVCISGDSAGGSLALTFLLAGGDHWSNKIQSAILLSPWVAFNTPVHRNTTSDYLDVPSLRKYAQEYVGKWDPDDSAVAPMANRVSGVWRQAWPRRGICVIYGSEEVFAPSIQIITAKWRAYKFPDIRSYEKRGGIHAWPVVALFLKNDTEERLEGLRLMVAEVKATI
ncbi:Alpha/Beta hydrolase protein [Xylariaceae sp. FL1019]|nr:Alpha/Beta hydrolase protein [Xylariaceae sp. FL1019]